LFIHIGENVVIPLKGVIAIMDIDSTNLSEDTRQFLKIAEEEGFIKKVNNEKPKSFILTEINKKSYVYLSPISSLTLSKRSGFVDKL